MAYGDSRFSIAHEKAFRNTANEAKRREYPSAIARRRDRIFAALWQQKHSDAVLAMTCSEQMLDVLEGIISDREIDVRLRHRDPYRTFSLTDIPTRLGDKPKSARVEKRNLAQATLITKDSLDYLVKAGQITADSARKLRELQNLDS